MSRTWFPLVVVAIVVSLSATARAQAWPKMRLSDRGDQVEIMVTGVRLVAEPVLSVRNERIEVTLAGRPPEMFDEPGDRTVRRMEIRGEGVRVLSVKLRGDNARVLSLLPGVVAVQEEGGVRLRIPRQPPPPGAEPVIIAPPRPEPGAALGTTAMMSGSGAPAPATTSVGANAPSPVAAVGAAAGPSAPTTAGSAATTASPSASSPSPAPSPAPSPVTGASPPAPGLGLVDDRAAAARLTGGSAGFGFGRLLLVVAAIALIGGAAVMLRRRRTLMVPTGPQLEVIASRHLGGKARVVWLGAGERELVIAIDPQQIRLLGQWRRGEHEPALAPRLEPGLDPTEPTFAAGSSPMPRVRTPVTAAVSGIMRLRGKVAPIADDIATGDADADEQWARDILSATGGRR